MATTDDAPAPRFYSVAEAARILGAAPVTLYRAIRAGEFPAVRIRGRLIVPASALEALSATTVSTGAPVDAAEWTSRPGEVGR